MLTTTFPLCEQARSDRHGPTLKPWQGKVDVYDMSDEGPHVGDCARCGRLVLEHQSHLMIVPSGRGRVFYHAGCEPLRTAEELARGELEADRVNWRKDAWKANRAAARQTLAEHDEPAQAP